MYSFIENELLRGRYFTHVCIRCGRERAVRYHDWIKDSWSGRTCGKLCRDWMLNTYRKRDWEKRPLRTQARRLISSDYVVAMQIMMSGGTLADAAKRLRVKQDQLLDFISGGDNAKSSGKDAK